MMPTVLTIAGFDPSSGAGITADLAVFSAHGLFGVSAITALTVQSTLGVRSVHPVGVDVLRDVLEELAADLPADGIKIGMLGTLDSVATVAEFIEGVRGGGRRPEVVLDPVLRSSSGRALLDDAGVDLLRRRLLPLVDWATPNCDELAVLSGLQDDLAAIPDKARILATARAFQNDYPDLGLVITGGHMEPPDDLLLYPHRLQSDLEIPKPCWLAGDLVKTLATHGTGCAFSSALLCRLVLGDDPLSAARAAKHYVVEAMRQAEPRGRGHGPMNLLWPLTQTA